MTSKSHEECRTNGHSEQNCTGLSFTASCFWCTLSSPQTWCFKTLMCFWKSCMNSHNFHIILVFFYLSIVYELFHATETLWQNRLYINRLSGLSVIVKVIFPCGENTEWEKSALDRSEELQYLNRLIVVKNYQPFFFSFFLFNIKSTVFTLKTSLSSMVATGHREPLSTGMMASPNWDL